MESKKGNKMKTLPITDSAKATTFKAWALAWELGYMIAVPIVILALLGRFLDKYLHTSPWLLLAGILLSIILSTFLVYRKTSEIIS